MCLSDASSSEDMNGSWMIWFLSYELVVSLLQPEESVSLWRPEELPQSMRLTWWKCLPWSGRLDATTCCARAHTHSHTHSSRLFLHCNWTSDWCPSTRNLPENTHQALWSSLKVLYYEKHVFSGLYIYKLVLPEPTNYQDEESKQFLHRLCSPHTGKTALLQAVQIQLLSLRNDRSHLHPFFRMCSLISDTDIDCAAGCLRSHQLSSTSTIGERVPQCNLEPYGTLFWKMFV